MNSSWSRPGRTPWPRLRISTAGPLALALGVLFTACESETLYDGSDITGPGGGHAPHAVGLVVGSDDMRLEAGQSLTFDVKWGPAQSETPVAKVGVAARVTTPSVTTPVFVRVAEVSAPANQTSATVSATLGQLLAAIPAQIPFGEPLTLALNAFAIDSNGACVASTTEELESEPCQVISGVPVESTTTGVPVVVREVVGTTVPLPSRVPEVGDIVLHEGSDRLYVSNRKGQTLEVVNLNGTGGPAFAPSGIPVGSHPWGLSLSHTGNEVIVANSGGTNFSFVDVANHQERRMSIPRVTLHDITLDVVDGGLECKIAWINFTDRPQFVAQDKQGRLLYSAGSSAAARLGTIRSAHVPAGGSALSAGLLFPGSPGNTPVYTPPLEVRGVAFARKANEEYGPLDYAIANLDSLTSHVVYQPPFAYPTCTVTLHDHVPGSPDQKLNVGPVPVENLMPAFQQLYEMGSDVVVFPLHRWDLPNGVESSDTTYVAASVDGQYVAFGEGVREPDARVTLWDASSLLSRFDDMADLMNNTSDRITGIDLNDDGSLGVMRGREATYFFDRTLRLQGTASAGLEDGNGIAVRKVNGRDLVFVGTDDATIQVLETEHYQAIAEIPVRNRVTGRLTVGPGRVPGDAATVYAVTEGGILVLGIPESLLK